ncbi:DUF732 domain-containing protein [Mycobacterium sp. HUMS_1102779]|uniref:DUF732 domain-containing protein n=1 Tax=Mycobacterium sp. HUMS_1102779 TaxID=3383487 RepID=UPI00389A34F5
MTTKLVKPMLIAAGIATFAAPVTAHADDTGYFNELNQAGIQFPDRAAAIAAAREVCDYIADGHTAAQTARGVKNANPELPLTQAGHFVTIARGAYCNQPIIAASDDQPVGEGAQP